MTDTIIFNVPDIGEGTAVAELVAWHIKPGDQVEEDQPIADLMTDKATVEITSPVAGQVLKCHGQIGDELAVGSVFVEFFSPNGEHSDQALVTATAIESGSQAPALALPDESDAGLAHHRSDDTPRRLTASPAVRRRASEMGIPLEAVHGSGPAGRIRQPDLDTYMAYKGLENGPAQRPTSSNPVAPQADSHNDVRETPLVGLRRKIAQKMTISARSIPHFSYVEEADVTALEEVRERLNGYYSLDRPKLTFLPFFISALCRTLPAFPQMNAQFDEESGVLREYRNPHIGVATQTASGLVVPVIRDAHRRGLWDLAAEISKLAGKAREGGLAVDQLSGSTITITSLGRLGGVVTTPVINHPEVAILGPNKIVERPVARDGAIALRKMMNISASFDHRVIDGQDAALFIQALKSLLEEPGILLAA